MKIECTPKEIADFVTELQSQLSKFEANVKLTEEDLEYLKEYITSTSKHSAWRGQTTHDFTSILDDLPLIGFHLN